jgi:hypothetical protein
MMMPSTYAYRHATGNLAADACRFAHGFRRFDRAMPLSAAMREGWQAARTLRAELEAARPLDVIEPELARAEREACSRPRCPDLRMEVYRLTSERDAATMAKRLAHLSTAHKRAMVAAAYAEGGL